MPRLSNDLLRRAARQNRLLPILLRECRDLESAVNELRWLKEHATESRSYPRCFATNGKSLHRRVKFLNKSSWKHLLAWNVRRRSRGIPLQYIIGNQPFGGLEIFCRTGVLIPRPETEVYTTKVANSLLKLLKEDTILQDRSLRILDLCTGTGCIALLLHSVLKKPSLGLGMRDLEDERSQFLNLQIVGVDISQTALKLANTNLKFNIDKGNLARGAVNDMSFQGVDVLSHGDQLNSPGTRLHSSITEKKPVPGLAGAIRSKSTHSSSQLYSQSWDVVISNPPYISPLDHSPGGRTSKSVRKFEPKLALVPPEYHVEDGCRNERPQQADRFYHHILQIARQVGAKLIALEIGDSNQAERVVQIAKATLQETDSDLLIEVWCDDGTVRSELDLGAAIPLESIDGAKVNTDRAVIIWRKKWAIWRRKVQDIDPSSIEQI